MAYCITGYGILLSDTAYCIIGYGILLSDTAYCISAYGMLHHRIRHIALCIRHIASPDTAYCSRIRHIVSLDTAYCISAYGILHHRIRHCISAYGILHIRIQHYGMLILSTIPLHIGWTYRTLFSYNIVVSRACVATHKKTETGRI